MVITYPLQLLRIPSSHPGHIWRGPDPANHHQAVLQIPRTEGRWCWWHYYGVILGTMASQITSLTIVYSTVYSSTDKRKHQSSVTGRCAGKSPGTSEFPTLMASTTENVSIWWRHHDIMTWKRFLHSWSMARRIHRSTMDSFSEGQWLSVLMLSLLLSWTLCSTKFRVDGDLTEDSYDDCNVKNI